MDEAKREPEPAKMNKAEAEIEIRSAMLRMAIVGGNNYEPSMVEAIIKQLDEGGIEPEEAVRQALVMENSKQDYH